VVCVLGKKNRCKRLRELALRNEQSSWLDQHRARRRKRVAKSAATRSDQHARDGRKGPWPQHASVNILVCFYTPWPFFYVSHHAPEKQANILLP
jgi:hypothetical protein